VGEATRSRQSQAIDLLGETGATFSGSQPQSAGNLSVDRQALINAVMDTSIKSFSKANPRSSTPPTRMSWRWQELGLGGTPPVVTY